MKKILEKTIENELFNYYSQNFSTKRQVRLSSKRIDLVTKCPITHEVWAIEVKIRDWKGAYYQALLNTMACDQSYVAMWHECASGAIKNSEIFRVSGVGLIVVDEKYNPTIVIPSKKRNNVNEFAYVKLANSL